MAQNSATILSEKQEVPQEMSAEGKADPIHSHADILQSPFVVF